MANDEAIVTPVGWLSRGEAFVPGKGTQLAVFGGIPGEKVKVRVEDRGGHPQRARALHPIGRPHPDRVEPRCDRFALCGHCSLMHLNDAAQDRVRAELVADAFRDELKAEPVVHGELWGFGHVVELVAGWSDQRRPRLGVRQRAGHRVVAIPECPLFTPSLREVMKVAAHWMIELDVHPWEGGRGSLRGLLARQSRATGEILLTLVYSKPTAFANTFAERIAGGVPEVVGAWAHWNDEPARMLAPGPEGAPDGTLIYGRPFITEAIDGLRFRLGPFDTWPDHSAAAERLAVDLAAMLAPAEGDAVVEINAGIGARTMLLARRSGWALGLVRLDDEARRAREDAAAAGVAAEFLGGPDTLEVALPRLQGRRPLVLADAGRKGLGEETLAWITGLDPRRVVVVGASPRAVARDVSKLVAGGLRLSRVVPYDLHPHTPFVETVALLESPDERAPEKRAPRRRRV